MYRVGDITNVTYRSFVSLCVASHRKEAATIHAKLDDDPMVRQVTRLNHIALSNQLLITLALRFASLRYARSKTGTPQSFLKWCISFDFLFCLLFLRQNVCQKRNVTNTTHGTFQCRKVLCSNIKTSGFYPDSGFFRNLFR